MKLLYVITLGTWGGAQQHLYSVIKDQNNRGNEIWLITGVKGKLTDKVNYEMPKVHIVVLENLKRNVNLKKMFLAIRDIRKAIRCIEPDIVHLHSTMAGVIGRIADFKMHNKLFFTVHGWAFTPGVSKKRAFVSIIVERFLSSLTDKFLCVSDYDFSLGKSKKIFKNSQQACVIKNGVEDLKLPPAKTSDKFIITMAARFNEQKNQELLLRAIAELPNKEDYFVFMLGDGPNLKHCQRLVEDLEISSIVCFKGMVDNVQDYYNVSNVVALVSYYEGLPISLIEALSLGKPIIASNVGGVSELFHENGYCVSNSSLDIKNAILNIKENNSLEHTMSLNSRQIFMKSFTVDEMVNKINDIYLGTKGENDNEV